MIRPFILLAVLVPAAGAQLAPSMFRGDAAHTGRYASGGGERFVGMQWRFRTDGDVTASPLVVRGVVYIGSGDGTMYAIDERSGDSRWTANLGAPIQSSAALVNDLVVVGSRDGRLHALDASNGTQRWQFATGKDLPLPWGHESGDVWTSSPTVANGKLLFGGGDGVLYAIDPARGTVLWRAPTGGRIRGTPAVHDGRVFIGAFDGRVYAFELQSGRRIWRYDTEGVGLNSANFGFDRRSIQSSPSVGGGMVFVGARDGFLYALDETTGALRWRFDHKVSWVNSSPAFSDGVVYAGSSDGHFVQAVDAKSGKELWRTNAVGIVWSSPAVTERYVYWGDGTGRLFVVDRAKGTQLSLFRTAAQVMSSPVIDGDLLIVGSGDGGVYALRLGNASAAPIRAVFFDSTYLRVSQVQNSSDVARYLIAAGYTKLDAGSLAKFLEQRLADRAPSVVVFAIDLIPADASKSPARSSLFRRYLGAGGKIVWLGLPPNIWPVEPIRGERKGLNEVVWDAPAELLGVSFAEAIFDQRGARATRAGERWGLTPRWRTGWSVSSNAVTRVLALDDWGLAAAWSKEYGGAPGTGFVRVPPDNLLSVYLAAEYRPVINKR